uniref:Uncharacterized protein n=1 Tax=Accipiter nisus TaxID=211598 RepID=A0A8B9MHH0_9AVES
MQPCLLLVLALLGTTSASHPGECLPRCPPRGDTVGTPWGPLHGRSVPPTCWAPAPTATSLSPIARTSTMRRWAEDGRGGLGSRGTTCHRGVPVTGVCPSPQHICARCYRGQLASVHSYSTNSLLRRQARLSTNSGQVWIGAITWPVVRHSPHPPPHPVSLSPVPTLGAPALSPCPQCPTLSAPALSRCPQCPTCMPQFCPPVAGAQLWVP